MTLQKGYKVLEIFEVYEYEMTQYDPRTCAGGLFVDYITRSLNLRLRHVGYPSWVRSPEDEVLYPGIEWREAGHVSNDKPSGWFT